MIIYPSIDIKDGKCVRILHENEEEPGDLAHTVEVNDNPADQAQVFEEQGFEWLHVIDLDAAKKITPDNTVPMEELLERVSIPVQFGGGIRSMQDIEFWLKRGVAQVILGTVSMKSPELLLEACREFPGQIVAAIDARDGYVAVEGWSQTTSLKLLDLALRVENTGVAAIIYTDIDRDGSMLGPDLDKSVDLAWAVTVPVIANGGVGSIQDLVAFKNEEDSGLMGVICGTALYDGRIDPAAALRLMKEEEDAA